MKTEIKSATITPEYAYELLRMNTNNRNIREDHVKRLAKSMKNGEWELSNDAIVISEGNVLLNGQHRLYAVIESNTPCPFIMFTGAKDSSFDIMDTQATRKLRDVIYRKGGSNSAQVETIINKLLKLRYDKEKKWNTTERFDTAASVVTRRASVECYEKEQDVILFWLNKATRLCKSNVALLPPATIAALAIFLNTDLGYSEDKVLEYLIELLVDGKTSHGTILAARKKLLRHRMKIELMPRHDDLRYVIRAWNDWILGRESKSIQTTISAFRFIYPV